MAKKITKMVKLQVPAGKATPAPPVGPALGQAGVNIMSFVKDFNDRTAKQAGLIIPVEITVYEDRSFTFICKTPPAAVLLKKAAGLEKASGEPNKKKVGKVTKAQVKEMWLTHFSPSLVHPEEYMDGVREIFPNSYVGKDGKSVDLLFEEEENE